MDHIEVKNLQHWGLVDAEQILLQVADKEKLAKLDNHNASPAVMKKKKPHFRMRVDDVATSQRLLAERSASKKKRIEKEKQHKMPKHDWFTDVYKDLLRDTNQVLQKKKERTQEKSPSKQRKTMSKLYHTSSSERKRLQNNKQQKSQLDLASSKKPLVTDYRHEAKRIKQLLHAGNREYGEDVPSSHFREALLMEVEKNAQDTSTNMLHRYLSVPSLRDTRNGKKLRKSESSQSLSSITENELNENNEHNNNNNNQHNNNNKINESPNIIVIDNTGASEESFFLTSSSHQIVQKTKPIDARHIILGGSFHQPVNDTLLTPVSPTVIDIRKRRNTLEKLLLERPVHMEEIISLIKPPIKNHINTSHSKGDTGLRSYAIKRDHEDSRLRREETDKRLALAEKTVLATGNQILPHIELTSKPYSLDSTQHEILSKQMNTWDRNQLRVKVGFQSSVIVNKNNIKSFEPNFTHSPIRINPARFSTDIPESAEYQRKQYQHELMLRNLAKAEQGLQKPDSVINHIVDNNNIVFDESQKIDKNVNLDQVTFASEVERSHEAYTPTEGSRREILV